MTVITAIITIALASGVYAATPVGRPYRNETKQAAPAKSSAKVSYVMINTATEQVIAFDEDENPLRVCVCSTGRSGNTTVGTYKTTNYYDWHLMNGGVYSRYAVRFNNHELMHSVPYYRHSPDSLEYLQFNKLGSPASAGCCRMMLADAKWIYENTTPGTIVRVVKDPTLAYDLTLPIVRIDTENTKIRGWDPTDDDPNSPYNDGTGGKGVGIM